MLCTKIVFCFCFDIQNYSCTQHVLNLYCSGNSMNNCGLTDSRIRASDTDLPVLMNIVFVIADLVAHEAKQSKIMVKTIEYHLHKLKIVTTI